MPGERLGKGSRNMKKCNHPIESLSKPPDASSLFCNECGTMFTNAESHGMKVRLWHNLEGKTVMEMLRNVTGIHYNYRRRYKYRHVIDDEVMVAFESDVHGTGGTYRLATVVEFEAVPETEKAEPF